MGIGFSIFLLAVGAMLAFAVHATVAGLGLVGRQMRDDLR